MALARSCLSLTATSATRRAAMVTPAAAWPGLERRPMAFQPHRIAMSQPGTSRRPFHTTLPQQSTFHFDSAFFVKRLELEGLTRKQAEGIVTVLERVVEDSISNMKRDLVTRGEQERLTYTQKVDFAKLQSEIQLVEKTDFTTLKAENERLVSDIERLKQRLKEEVTKTKAGVRLDLNLEKGRIRDEMSVRQVKLTEVDTRLENEISTLRTSLETVKFSILQYLVGTVASGLALLLAGLRFLK